jgi:hypothetical protein
VRRYRQRRDSAFRSPDFVRSTLAQRALKVPNKTRAKNERVVKPHRTGATGKRPIYYFDYYGKPRQSGAFRGLSQQFFDTLPLIDRSGNEAVIGKRNEIKRVRIKMVIGTLTHDHSIIANPSYEHIG